MSIIIPANSAVGGGFDVANSARFNKGSSDSLTRTQSASPTSATKGTLSFWIKRSLLDVSQYYMSTFQDSNNRVQSWFQANNTFKIIQKVSASTTIEIITNRVFRDISAWYHVVLAFDTDQGTSSNRVKIYINGDQETSFSTATYPAQGQDAFLTKGTSASLGAYNGSGDYTSAYFSEIVLIDGQQLTPTSFGEFDEDSGVWKAIDVSGLTFGTNGYYLDFEDSSALGNDAAGSNNFTANNITANRQSEDTCTNNGMTWNVLWSQSNGNVGDVVFSEGNLTSTTSASYRTYPGTIGVSSGKWYWEIKRTNTDNDLHTGIMSELATPAQTATWIGSQANGWVYAAGSGSTYTGNSETNTGYSATGNGGIISVAFDADNGKIYFGVNGTWQGSGNPATGSNPAYTGLDTSLIYFPCASTGSNLQANFGSPPYGVSSTNADANDYGDFEYAVPSGYLTLNTKNLSEALS